MENKSFRQEIIPTDDKCPNCGAIINERHTYLLGNHSKMIMDCECVIEARQKEFEKNVAIGAKIMRKQWKVDAGIKARYIDASFETIQRRTGQEKGFDAAIQFAENYMAKAVKEGLLLVGSVGSGKTLLSAIIVNHIIENTNVEEKKAADVGGSCSKNYYDSETERPKIIFSSMVCMLSDVRNTFDNINERTQKTIDKYAKSRLLVLDDMGAEKLTEWGRERLMEIIDYRYNEFLPLVVTTNLPPKMLREAIGDRIYDRIREMCTMVDVTAKSQRITAGKESEV